MRYYDALCDKCGNRCGTEMRILEDGLMYKRLCGLCYTRTGYRSADKIIIEHEVDVMGLVKKEIKKLNAS